MLAPAGYFKRGTHSANVETDNGYQNLPQANRTWTFYNNCATFTDSVEGLHNPCLSSNSTKELEPNDDGEFKYVGSKIHCVDKGTCFKVYITEEKRKCLVKEFNKKFCL